MGAYEYEEFYSVVDYEQWEGDWELIYGKAYAMAPSPIITHQFVSTKIISQLDNQMQNCKECFVLSESDWEISNDIVLKPDILILCKEEGEKITKTPEIIFEIISPSTAQRDEILKFDIYQKEGVKYYTLVYPKNRIAKVYKLHDNGKFIKQGDFEDETFAFKVNECKTSLNFSKIWR